MTSFHTRVLATGIVLTMCAAGPVAQAQSDNQAATTSAGTSFPDWTNGAPRIVSDGTVEEGAVDALRRMSAYLMSLNTIGLVSESSLDAVTEDGQRIQMDGRTTYKIRKPGFVIDYASDMKARRFYYDGKQFTVYSPKLNFYSTVPAPATNREVLDVLYKRYGISLPLEDLFRWDAENIDREKKLKSAYPVGPATIDGVLTNHYAFREEKVDWEVWIQSGDRPLPRKLVIVDRSDPTFPAFIARLSWSENPAFAASDFTFVPDKDAKRIQLATYQEAGE